ncbi:MAG: hypothetical protein IKG56_05705 [Clostridia bacterium]|nr:hypothetical protein [Clostridia bacterium]
MNDELIKYKEFKENYEFKQKSIEVIDGKEYCDGYPLFDEEGKEIGECDKWINVGYKYSGAYPKVLSNLFPYEFEFRGKKLNSIESFFQGIKFKNVEMQNLVFNYSGLDSNNIKVCNDYDWKITGKLFWQGEELDRFSKEYENLVDELYISAIQNPLYRNALKNCKKDIIHTLGVEEKEETVFTRHEFEKQLNSLKDFLKI